MSFSPHLSKTCCNLTLGLGLCLFPGLVHAQTTATAADPHGKPGRSAAEVARWNDRSTPRRMLETFFFAIYCYDLAPELIVNAIDCLDLSGLGHGVSEGDAALMAHELNSIVSRRDVALYSVPDDPKLSQPSWTLVADRNFSISLEQQTDGRWRFGAATILNIPAMRIESSRGQRAAQEARMKLAEGRTDPEATMRSFLMEVVRHDFTAAARCLDLRDIPAKLRSARGPELARKLAFVIQRCGFVFPQEIISDPDGWRYIWHSNHRGRVMLDRVRQIDGRDAWLFSRGTVRNLDAMVEGFRRDPPDPRYEFVGVVVDAAMLPDGGHEPAAAPPSVPPQLASARAALRTFLDGMDELEFDDERTRLVLSCLDLGQLADLDRSPLGLRTAAKLDAVLRHLNIDLLSVPDAWEAEPQSFGKEQESQAVLARQPDGTWRFDADTVARVPEMFDRLSPEEKTGKDRASQLGSARQTVRTLIQAAERGDSTLAARTLDLSAVPVRAQLHVGPILAHKLKFVIDQVGPIQLQEIPNEIEGPRHVLYRGPLGRISIEPAASGTSQGQWLFTAETVAQIESMFAAALARGTSAGDRNYQRPRNPLCASTVGILLRAGIPGWLQVPVLGLEAYQWIGLAVLIGLTTIVTRLGYRSILRALTRVLGHFGFALEEEFLQINLRPVAWLIAGGLASAQLAPLDLPVAFWSRALPMIELAWIGLFAWSALRLVDLGMALYTSSEPLLQRRNLSDMIVPTAVRFLKLGVLVVAVSWVVYVVGSGEWLTRLLAGLGLVGLAASLAAQDTLKNFFGTLLLIGEHPFKLGDSIVVNNMEGVVESVGFRSTWLRTADDSLITIPNSIIANASIDNRGARNSRRFRTIVGIRVDTPADRLVALRDGLRAFARSHPRVLPERIDIYLHTLNDAKVDLLVNLYLKVDSSAQELEARDELTREILEQARSAGVELAEPSQTIVVAHSPEPRGAVRGPRWATHGGRSEAAPGGGVTRLREP
jgi:MscS family membrane protein